MKTHERIERIELEVEGIWHWIVMHRSSSIADQMRRVYGRMLAVKFAFCGDNQSTGEE